MPRDFVKLVCTVCGEENYHTNKNKKTTPERLEFNKYCSRCQKQTSHKEKK
ncbi:MAG: 50S ribosomal protein L33 [Acholeplasmatales bacterium]|nr:50S ribosomal protein L33 [Acholeplasmatales bacterium]